MEALLVSAGVVAIGEIGDKTQLLSLVLAAHPVADPPGDRVVHERRDEDPGHDRPRATVARGVVPADVLRWLVAASFFAVALWALKPDTFDEARAAPPGKWGVFGITTVAFFLAEMGDKTQVATVILAARFHALAQVVIGTTLGMLAANIPVVFAGKLAADRIPFTAIRIAAALIFAALGVWVLVAGVPE